MSDLSYLYCSKLGHIACFCYKAKNKMHENAKNAKNNDDYAFGMRNKAHSKSMCKWIVDSEATKHMTSHRATFDTYEILVHAMCIQVMMILSKPLEWGLSWWKQL